MPFDPAVIRASFAVVERRADQLTKFFYAHLFTNNPGVEALFPARLAEQRDRLFAALTQLVLRLEEPEKLTGYLAALGRDHRKFQAAPEHYPAVGASLIAALKHFSGHSWTPEIEKAWVEAFTVISQAMIDAAAAVPESTPRWWNAEVLDRRRAAPDLTVLTLRPDRPYPFTAGQYLTVCSDRQPHVWRPYSLACAPRSDNTLELHVRRVPDGLLSTALVNDVLPGETVRLGPPLGEAVLAPDSDRPLLMVAAGTGWAPAKALLEQLARDGGRPTTVFVAARSDADQYDLASVHELVKEHAWLHAVLSAPEPGASRNEAAKLLRAGLAEFGDCSGHDIHVSGPPDLVPAVAAQLLDQNAEPGLLRHDPVAATFNRSRPLTPAEWFLEERDVPWINRTELG
ncbi:globin domain-containing protein [Streptomyces sp. TLI_171]|uniref:globin domain-containing protein n=1 Tax=Streptomyces sp. TLI_171 TaxID=1938859 RepID=UPI000C1A03BE|nr:globin domain-containing protein [Streptomyces sp. TLI_171]RKE20138.1 NAD(P)H-flavin reductase [Streptomyces sp. TLI_171]